MSDSDVSSDGPSLNCFARMTRNGNAVMKLINRIDNIMKEKTEDLNFDSHTCIICCDRKKTSILLPCRHQQTCESCWQLWSIQCMAKNANKSFNESDEDATKPICPYCKSYVDTVIDAIN